MVIRIVAGILVVSGVEVLIFFKNYHGALIPYPSLFFVGGLLLIFAGAFMFYRTADNGVGVLEKEVRAQRKKLKENNEFIVVDLAKCDILRNDYQQEVLQDTARGRAWDALADDRRNTQREIVHQSVLRYETVIGGTRYKFSSQSVNIEYTTLRFRLDAQKETKLYYNKYDPAEYYFDLEFLFARQHTG